MLEKLNSIFLNTKKKFNTFELELFIELISNYIQWEFILDIMNLENNEEEIIKKIDSNSLNLIEHSKDVLSKVNRIDWVLKNRLRNKKIDDFIQKSFLYPVFLWLLSLNILTFMLIYVLPNIITSFNQIVSVNNMLNILMILTQLIIGVEWGILLLSMYLALNTKERKIFDLYQYLYQRYPNNIWVYYSSYLFLSDFLYLLNQSLNIDQIIKILKYSNSIVNREICNNLNKNLNNGQSIKSSFDLLDKTFIKLIKIDDFDQKFDTRLNNYLNVLNKKIEISIKKYANYFMTLVYVQVGLMVFLVYSILLYPLKIIEGMNL